MEDSACEEIALALSRCSDPVVILGFLESILTPHELKEVGTRWKLVQMMLNGVSQREVSRRLHLSLCKITRGARQLKKADSPFKTMLRLLENPS